MNLHNFLSAHPSIVKNFCNVLLHSVEIWEFYCHLNFTWNSSKSKCKDTETTKVASFHALNYQKLVSRKIWVTEIIAYFTLYKELADKIQNIISLKHVCLVNLKYEWCLPWQDTAKIKHKSPFIIIFSNQVPVFGFTFKKSPSLSQIVTFSKCNFETQSS